MGKVASNRPPAASTKGWKIMRAVFYRRCSSDEQAESGAGLGAQLDACRAHADRAGLEVAGDFSDEGIGGAAPIDKRPGLLDALALVGKGDVLLVAKRDQEDVA